MEPKPISLLNEAVTTDLSLSHLGVGKAALHKKDGVQEHLFRVHP